MLLGLLSPALILTTVPSEELKTVTTNDVTVLTDPQAGLYITFSKEEHTSLVKLWTLQELHPTGDVVTQFDISEIYLNSHELTTSCTPQKIVLVYYYARIVSASNKPTTLRLTVIATTNGIEITGELIDFAINGKDNTFVLNYERDGVRYQFAFDSYSFTLPCDFGTTQKTWFSVITDPFTELFAPKEDIAA